MASGNYGWNIGSVQSSELESEGGGQYPMPSPEKNYMGEECDENRKAFLGAEGYSWVVYNGEIPSQAIKGGFDLDETPIYVGRAFHAGDVLPAKCLLEKNVAYVSHGGEEHRKDEFEVLCHGGNTVRWQASSNGEVPHFALKVGLTSNFESLFVGRVPYQGSLTVGKVHPSYGCCFIPFGGKEHSFPHYEVLELVP